MKKLDTDKSIILIGAGGHARMVNDILLANDYVVAGYVDRATSSWLSSGRHFLTDAEAIAAVRDEAAPLAAAIGIGGVAPEVLKRRHEIACQYKASGVSLPSSCHPQAVIGSETEIDDAVLVAPCANVGAGAKLSFGCLINTRANVEHDAVVEEGAHIAPGATILGGARVGKFAMIGAGAVVLPGARVEDAAMVRALSVFG